MCLPVTIRSRTETVPTDALIDSGAEGNFIDQDLVDNNGLKTFSLERKVNVYNVNGTPNTLESITRRVKLTVTH